MPKCIILSGIPCSGKSTYAEFSPLHYNLLSCDKIRKELYGEDYKFDYRKEDLIWVLFYKRLYLLKSTGHDIIIDNTNCRLSYINKILEVKCPIDYQYEIVKFDIPLWKAHYRNIVRYWKNGKYIPFNVINNMHKNYKKLWSTSGLHQTLIMGTKT